MKKKLPRLKSDAAAEDFVATADLTRYDLSGMVPVRFEMKPKNKSVSLRQPEPLLQAVRQRARKGAAQRERMCALRGGSKSRCNTGC